MKKRTPNTQSTRLTSGSTRKSPTPQNSSVSAERMPVGSGRFRDHCRASIESTLLTSAIGASPDSMAGPPVMSQGEGERHHRRARGDDPVERRVPDRPEDLAQEMVALVAPVEEQAGQE